MLCAWPRRVEDLVVSEIEGLQVRKVCRFHGDMVTEPSHTDLKEECDPIIEAASAVRREEPYGMEPWWENL